MAILKKYNKQIHDIHNYQPDANYNPRVDGNQISYNASCQASNVDWSGISLRSRSFCRTLSNTSGFTEPYNISDINFWNTCNPCAVLISPKHALICQHYRGTHERVDEYYTFMGKSGKKYTKKVIKATINIGSDHTLLEFDSEFTNDVSHYSNIADIAYVPKGTDLWVCDCNGKAYKVRFETSYLVTSGPYTGSNAAFSYSPIFDGINDGIGHAGWISIHVGDSGSPSFVLDTLGNTIFVGLQHGGPQVNNIELANINAIINQQGYSVSHYKLSAISADLNQDGKINGEDLAILMASWGNNDSFKDINADGIIDSNDLSVLLNSWGEYVLKTNLLSSQANDTTTTYVKPRA